ncbi:autotransporter outer membrane beta-barrel domain-containing protein, partial [Variovorax sp. KK3]
GGTTGTLGTGGVTNNAALVFNRSDAVTVANPLSGTGTLTQAGSGTTVLTGANIHSGPTIIRDGTLQIGDGGTTGTPGTGAVTNDAALVFNRSDAITVANVVSGGGSVTQNGSGILRLSGTNAYTGATHVQAGALALTTTGSIAASSGINVAAGARFDISSAAAGSVVRNLTGAGNVLLGESTLTIAEADGEFSGALSGSGNLVKRGAGTFLLSGDSSYTGGTSVKGGTLAIGRSSALGTGTLSMDDHTTLAFAADGIHLANAIAFTGNNDPVFDTGSHTVTITGGIAGAADLTKAGSGTLVLGAANNSYRGATTIAEGTLAAGAPNAFSPASAHVVAAGATLDLAGYSQSLASVTNSGTVSLLGSRPGTVLTVHGPWIGQGGLLKLGEALDTTGGPADKLLLSGPTAIASGSTRVQITDLRGLGGQTTGRGIEIVGTENGASIQPNAFSLAAPVSAGAYEYHLEMSGSGAYLSSTITLPPPVVPDPPLPPSAPAPAPPPAAGGAPAPTPAPTPSSPPATPPAVVVSTYRAEVPLLAGLPEQLREGGLAMLGSRHQRRGDDAPDSATAANRDARRLGAWARIVGVERRIAQAGTVAPVSQGRLSGLEAGTDLWAHREWRAGMYAGQLEGHMNVAGFARGVVNYQAGRNQLRMQYLGAYATWENEDGLYVDAVLQTGRLHHDVQPSQGARFSGKGSSLIGSVEMGHAWQVAPNWTIESRLQLVHQRLDLDDNTIVGATVHHDSDSAWLVRAGVRVKGLVASAAGTLQPYARFDVYRRGSGTDVTRFSTPAARTDIVTKTGGTSTELAAGLGWQLSPALNVYGELGTMWAAAGPTKTRGGLNASLGLKARW